MMLGHTKRAKNSFPGFCSHRKRPSHRQCSSQWGGVKLGGSRRVQSAVCSLTPKAGLNACTHQLGLMWGVGPLALVPANFLSKILDEKWHMIQI